MRHLTSPRCKGVRLAQPGRRRVFHVRHPLNARGDAPRIGRGGLKTWPGALYAARDLAHNGAVRAAVSACARIDWRRPPAIGVAIQYYDSHINSMTIVM